MFSLFGNSLCLVYVLLNLGAESLHLQQRPQDTNPAFQIPKPSTYLGYRETGGMECGLNHSEDLYTPIPEVLAKHPGVDGYCYFEFHAPWMVYNVPPASPDYLEKGKGQVKYMRSNMCKDDPGMDKGPLTDIFYEGDNKENIVLHSHLDCMHMRGDDVYCHAVGWLRGQDPSLNFALISNATAWEALADEKCKGLQQKYNFSAEEITLGRHIDDQGSVWDGPARSLVLHAYHKCLLGHGVDEMTYCQSLACLLPGNEVGHGSWCRADSNARHDPARVTRRKRRRTRAKA